MLVRDHWQLNPDVDFLNHGSFGACPTIVLQKQAQLIGELERDPIKFLAPERELQPKLDEVRQTISRLVNASKSDIAFVRNATDGVNAVLSSFPLKPNDEILITNHGYNACNNAAYHAAERAGSIITIADIPFPLHSDADVIAAVEKQITSRTRLILIDHVTSPTGLILPVEEIISLARARNIRVLVDGAHAPGMLPIDLTTMAPDYYTANHHKWLCAPKASGFLFVTPELQDHVRPNVISHGANRTPTHRTRFLTEFDWTGTHDPTPLLAVTTAIEFMNSIYPGGLTEVHEKNRQKTLRARKILCDALEITLPSHDSMIGSLATVPIQAERFCKLSKNTSAAEYLQSILFQKHHFELPVFQWHTDFDCLRISMQAYNEISQIERLAKVLATLKQC